MKTHLVKHHPAVAGMQPRQCRMVGDLGALAQELK